MGVWIGTDLGRFAAAARPFLEAELERNVLATVLLGVESGRYREAHFGLVSDPDGNLSAVLLRTPPHLLLAAGTVPDPDGVARAWLAADPRCPGVSAEPALAAALAAAFVAAGAGPLRRAVAEALHVLDRVIPPAVPAPGRLRAADWRERAQLGDWGIAFAREAGLATPSVAAAAIEASITRGRLWVWEDEGAAVSMVGHTDVVAGSVRIGPVYTPPSRRGRGYATSAVAEVSQARLDRGAARCLLYTDLANPVSNHIYAKLGYRRIADWEEWRGPAGA